MLHERPVCFDCTEVVEHSPVYEAPCGHPRCPSVVFHGVCLMCWREKREEIDRMLKKWLSRHTEHGR